MSGDFNSHKHTSTPTSAVAASEVDILQRGKMSTPAVPASHRDNPYLKHLPPHQRGAARAPSAVESASAVAAEKEPLYGFMPRKVTAKQVVSAMVCVAFYVKCLIGLWDRAIVNCTNYSMKEHNLNPFTKQPHSPEYKQLLEGRKKLPVFAQMKEFYKIVSVTCQFYSIISRCCGRARAPPSFVDKHPPTPFYINMASMTNI